MFETEHADNFVAHNTERKSNSLFLKENMRTISQYEVKRTKHFLRLQNDHTKSYGKYR